MRKSETDRSCSNNSMKMNSGISYPRVSPASIICTKTTSIIAISAQRIFSSPMEA